MKYIKLFEEFVAEDLPVNENISITPRWTNVFFDGIKKRIGAKRVNIDRLGNMTTIDFDDKLRLFAKDNQIIGYNLDMSEAPLELGKTINSFGDIERNIKLFSGNDKPLKGKPVAQVQLPEIASDGTKEWKNAQGQPHRLDGPAIEWADGDKHWYQNGKFHRLDGPAVEMADGDKHWYQNGKYHRLDGPAIERSNGTRSWYINGKRLTEESFLKKTTQT